MHKILGLALVIMLAPVAAYASIIEPISPRVEIQGSQARNAMAILAERIRAFRPLLDGDRPFLAAKISGPFQYKPLFGDPQTYYCVQVEMDQLLAKLIKEIRTLAIRMEKHNGKTYYRATNVGISGNTPTQCLGKKYEPFPELLQARLRRIRTKS
jgi:hypothetical protein